MRIFEINDEDKSWAAISRVDLDIDRRYNYAIYILTILLQSKSANRTSKFLPEVTDIENDFIWILNQNFANDQSTTELKNKTQKYLAEIQKLKGRL